MRIADLAGKRVAIWGAGREGRAAIAAIRARLPGLALDVLCSREEAAELRAAGVSVTCVTTPVTRGTLGRYDVVVKSPGISPYAPPASEALDDGVRFVSGTALWFAEHGSARTIAVTGTKGKSTTVALLAHLLRAAGHRVALCGNIGMPLLELLDPDEEPNWWVVELSSYQTRDMDAVPDVAVVLNVFPEHLDWHGGYENYQRDKLRILGAGSRRPRIAVLGPDVEFAARGSDLGSHVGGASAPTEASVGAEAPPTVGSGTDRDAPVGAEAPPTRAVDVRRFGTRGGFHVDEGGIARGDELLVPWDALPLPGRHNALNVCASLTVIEAIGVEVEHVLPALATFGALPHRLQPLGTRDGIEYVNDSIATTPHATLAALAFFGGRKVTVLVGGYDRGVPWDVFRTGMDVAPAYAVVAMGQNGERIAQALAGLSAPRVLRASSLDEAVRIARELTPEGGVVLLSPGAPSFGEFRDYVERGRRFAELAGFDPDRIASIEGLGIA